MYLRAMLLWKEQKLLSGLVNMSKYGLTYGFRRSMVVAFNDKFSYSFVTRNRSVLKSCHFDSSANKLFSLPVPSVKVPSSSEPEASTGVASSANGSSFSSVEGSPVKKQDIVVQLLKQPCSISQADMSYLENMCMAVSKGIEMDVIEDFGPFIATLPEIKNAPLAAN